MKKSMKSIWIHILSLVLIALLTGCSVNNTTQNDSLDNQTVAAIDEEEYNYTPAIT